MYSNLDIITYGLPFYLDRDSEGETLPVSASGRFRRRSETSCHNNTLPPVRYSVGGFFFKKALRLPK